MPCEFQTAQNGGLQGVTGPRQEERLDGGLRLRRNRRLAALLELTIARQPIVRLYLREGNVRSAEKTLKYIEAADTVIPDGLAEEVWGDIQLNREKYAEALKFYERALAGVQKSARHRARSPRIRFQRGLAMRALTRHSSSIPELKDGLDHGGAPRGPQGWIQLIESTLATAKTPEDYARALEFCDRAAKGELNETSHRAITWHRSHALAMLGRQAEADQLLQDLSGGSDSWAIMAVEAQLDLRFKNEIECLISLPEASELVIEPLKPVSLSDVRKAAEAEAAAEDAATPSEDRGDSTSQIGALPGAESVAAPVSN